MNHPAHVINVNIIFASFGGGYGVVHNKKTGRHT